MLEQKPQIISEQLAAFFQKLDSFDEPIDPDTLKQMLSELDLTKDDMAPYIRFNDDWYARNRIHIGRNYHALALCWGPGQCSAIHDHAGSACGVKVIEGVVTETKYDRADDGTLTESVTGQLSNGEVCASYDSDIHILRNVDNENPMITLHIYSPPLLHASTYCLTSPDPIPWSDPVIDEVPPSRFDD